MNLKETHSSYRNVAINEVESVMIMVTVLVVAIFDHDVK